MARPFCIIAGVGPGLGMALARRFSQEGMDLALLARQEKQLAGFCREIGAAGGSASAYPVDLVEPEAVAARLAEIIAQRGPPMVGIYNAAAWRAADAMQVALPSFAADLQVCATSALAFAQTLAPAMRGLAGASLLFTGGGFALYPEAGAGVVSLAAGKSALRGLVLAMAGTMEADGIHCATVTVAGTIDSGSAFSPDRIAQAYWTLHRQERSQWQRELVYDGT